MTALPNTTRMLSYLAGRAAKAVEDKGDRVLTITGATQNVARDGGILTSEGWETEAYLANPVFLYGHDQTALPIGRCLKLRQDSAGLVFEIEFATKDLNPFADLVYRMYKAGFIRGASVGFRVLDGRDPTSEERRRGAEWVSIRHELLELSAVPVGADPKALAESRGLSSFTPGDVKMLRGIGLPAFKALAREIEKMAKRTTKVRSVEGGIVATIRKPDLFDADRGFAEAPWEHDGKHAIVAVIGVLRDGGKAAIQSLRFGKGWDLEAALAFVSDDKRAAAFDSWRADDTEEEEETDEEKAARLAAEEEEEEETDEEKAAREEAEAKKKKDEEEEEPEEMRALVTRLLDVLERVDTRLANIEEREAAAAASGDDKEDEEEEDEAARSIDAVAASVVPAASDEDPYDLGALARDFAGVK